MSRFFVKQCADIFGASFTPSFVSASVDASNSYYGALAYTGTRVVLPNGSVDPWHALGVLHDLGTDTRAIYINGILHNPVLLVQYYESLQVQY